MKTFFVPIQGFIGQFEIAHQIDRMSKTPFPSGNYRDRAIALLGKPNLWNADLVVELEEQILKRKPSPLFVELRILGSSTHIAPSFGLQGRLELNPIKFSIPQKGNEYCLGQSIFVKVPVNQLISKIP